MYCYYGRLRINNPHLPNSAVIRMCRNTGMCRCYCYIRYFHDKVLCPSECLRTNCFLCRVNTGNIGHNTLFWKNHKNMSHFYSFLRSPSTKSSIIGQHSSAVLQSFTRFSSGHQSVPALFIM